MAKKKSSKTAPEMPKDQKAKVSQREHYAAQAKKKDPGYEGETENTAIYGPGAYKS